jgi:hypothetical protein
LLSKATTYLVTTSELLAKGGFKFDTARKYGVSIITIEELQNMKPVAPVPEPVQEQIGGLDLPEYPRDGSGPSTVASTPRSVTDPVATKDAEPSAPPVRLSYPQLGVPTWPFR